MDLVRILLICHHGRQQISRHIRCIHIPSQIHGGSHRGRFCVVLIGHSVDMDSIQIPVGGVLGHDPLILGLIGRQHIGTAVQQVFVGGAKLIAAGLHKSTIGGHERPGGDHGHKIGAGLGQGVLQSVIIQSLDTNILSSCLRDFLQDLLLPFFVGDQLDGLAVFIGSVHRIGEGQPVGCPLVIGLGTCNDPGVLGSTCRCVGSITDIPGRIDKVVGRHIGHFLAVLVHPLHILAKLEGPHGSILVGRPFQSQSRFHLSVAIIFHQAVHHIGGNGHFIFLGGDQVIQGRNFRSIELAEHSILRNGRGWGAFRGIRRFIRCAGSHAQSQRQGQQDTGNFLNTKHSSISSFPVKFIHISSCAIPFSPLADRDP